MTLNPRVGYGFAQTPSVPLLGGRNKTDPYRMFYIVLEKRADKGSPADRKPFVSVEITV